MYQILVSFSKFFLIPYLILHSIHAIAQPAQQSGKKYKALLSEACKLMTDGGCMIYTYRVLAFNQDSVTVSYEVNAKCNPQEREKNYNNPFQYPIKNYKWSTRSNQLIIEGFNEYGELILQNATITGFDKSSGRRIEFSEVRK